MTGRGVVAVAHQGDPYRATENTLPSFRSAIAAGADAVELDVRATADGVPVVVHDPTLRRLWGHDRPVATLTAAISSIVRSSESTKAYGTWAAMLSRPTVWLSRLSGTLSIHWPSGAARSMRPT